MAAERCRRYLGVADELDPTTGGDQFEFDEADIWNVGEIILPESSKTVLSVSRTIRKPVRKRVEADQFPVVSKSLPLNVPNWSKISGIDRGGENQEAGNDRILVIPPHEYLARSRAASMSVHEGVGRTLKGRDLSNLRNTVMRKTGIED